MPSVKKNSLHHFTFLIQSRFYNTFYNMFLSHLFTQTPVLLVLLKCTLYTTYFTFSTMKHLQGPGKTSISGKAGDLTDNLHIRE